MTAIIAILLALLEVGAVWYAVWFIRTTNRELRHWQQLAAQRHAENVALRKMVLDKTGVSVELWQFADICDSLVIDHPRANIKINGITQKEPNER